MLIIRNDQLRALEEDKRSRRRRRIVEQSLEIVCRRHPDVPRDEARRRMEVQLQAIEKQGLFGANARVHRLVDGYPEYRLRR